MKTFKRRHLTSLLLTSLVVSVFVLPLRAIATVDDGYTEKIREFHADITLSTDGALLITERILYDFGTEKRHGIYREIPSISYTDYDRRTYGIQVHSVTDENRNPYQYEHSGATTVSIKIGDPNKKITGAHWYVITYSAGSAVTGFNNYDELYWNITGNGWQVPILLAYATVHIPNGSSEQQNGAWCYTGAYGSTDTNCTARVDSETTYSFTAAGLPAFNGLTIAATFGKGIVTNPVRLSTVKQQLVDMRIQPDGSATVEERVQYQFGDGSLGGYGHEYANELREREGEFTRLSYIIHSVSDENGTAYRLLPEPDYPLKALMEEVHISRGDMPMNPAWIVTNYTIPHAVSNFEDNDALTLNPLGMAWGVPVEKAEVTVTLPETDESGSVKRTATCTITQYSYVTDDCSGEYAGDGAYKFTAENIQPNKEMRINAAFNRGIVTPSSEIVIAEPRIVAVDIDGNKTLYTALETIRVDAGEHRIRVEVYKYEPFTTTVNLAPGETAQVRASLTKLTTWVIIDDVLPFALLVLLGGGVFLLWYKRGKDPKGRGVIVHQYDPPKGMTPAELGVVHDMRFGMREVTATLIHLAIRGYIHIEQIGKRDYTFHKLKDFREDATLLEYEQNILKGIFTRTDTKERKLSDLKNKFYTHVPGIRRALYRKTISDGYFPFNPGRTRAIFVTAGILGTIVLVQAAYMLNNWLDSPWYYLLVIVGVEMLILGPLMPSRTKKGTLAFEHIQGLKKYLTVAEQARIKFHQSPEAYREHFEALLPYAVVLKVEKEWAVHFKTLFDVEQSSSWYGMSGAIVGATAADLANSLSSMSAAVGTSFASSPSSGGGGGGFSGGGGGGGGGGSW